MPSARITRARFDGMVAIVTGGASGIGRETAGRLAREGASVLIVDRNEAEAEAAVERICADGGKAAAHIVDLNDAADYGAIPRRAVEAFGSLDILINNAGIGANRPALDTDRTFWNRVLKTNLDTCFFCSQAVAGEMIARKADGRIVNVSSHAALRGGTGQAAYAASKAGMLAITRVMAVEFAEHGITVNAIAPGPVTTPMSAHHPIERTVAWMNAMPIRRYGTVNDVAAAILFFCDRESSHITGQTLSVDGGFTAQGLAIRPPWTPE